MAQLRHPNAVRALAFSPDGTRLCTAGADNVARVFSERGGWRETAVVVFGEPVEWVGFSPGELEATPRAQPTDPPHPPVAWPHLRRDRADGTRG